MTSRHCEFDVVVIGAGPAGIAAAIGAAEAGKRVGIVDESPWLGGQIWRGAQHHSKNLQARKWIARLASSGATRMSQTTVIAEIEPGILLAETADHAMTIGWSKLVLAVGARELFLPFPGWTLPGVVGVGGLQALVKAGWPIEGKRVVIAGTGPLLLAVADGLLRHVAKVNTIAEQAPWSRVWQFARGLVYHPGKLAQAIALRARTRHVKYRCGTWPLLAEGDATVRSVTLTDGVRSWIEPCDTLACGFGLVPNVELPLLLGCELSGDFVRVNEKQESTRANVFCAGEPTGIGGAECALVEGMIAGLHAAGEEKAARSWFSRRSRAHRFREALRETFALTGDLKKLARDETLVCRCEDVAYHRLRGLSSWRQAKLQTRCGMGPCQGRICGAATRVMFGWGMESVRPPLLPSRIHTLMTQYHGDM